VRKTEFLKEEKGSFTLEATITLVVYMMSIIIFINWIRGLDASAHIYGAMYKGMYEISVDMKDGEVSGVSSAFKEDDVTIDRIKQIMDKDYIDKTTVIKGLEGIDISYKLTGQLDKDIDITSTYYVDIPFLPGAVCGYIRKQNMVCRAFTGDVKNKSNKKFVYMTKSGTVYHTNVECTYILVKKKRVAISEIDSYRNSSGGKYDVCKECKNEINTKGYVYITNYGTSYHNLATCSTIARTVRAVEVSEVIDKKACEKCVEGK
jgi:hypothetical protein